MAWFGLYAHTTAHLYPIVTDFEHEIFGVDSQDADLMLRELTLVGVDAQKHPLYALLARPLVASIEWLSGSDVRSAAQTLVAGLAAANVLGLLLLVRRFFCNWPLACIVAAAFGLSFAGLVIFSVPETYALGSLLVMAYAYAFLRVKDRLTPLTAGLLGMLAGLAGLANPVLLTLGLIPGLYLLQSRGFRRTVPLACIMLLASVLLFCVVVVSLWGTPYFRMSVEYAEDWASLGHFMQPKAVVGVVVQLFLYAAVAPVEELRLLYRPGQLFGFVESWPALVALCGYGLGFLAVARRLWKVRDPVDLSLAGWLLFSVGFWIYFNPAEAILYAVLLLPCVAMLIGSSLHDLPRQPGICAVALVTLLCTGVRNVDVVLMAEAPGQAGSAPAFAVPPSVQTR